MTLSVFLARLTTCSGALEGINGQGYTPRSPELCDAGLDHPANLSSLPPTPSKMHGVEPPRLLHSHRPLSVLDEAGRQPGNVRLEGVNTKLSPRARGRNTAVEPREELGCLIRVQLIGLALQQQRRKSNQQCVNLRWSFGCACPASATVSMWMYVRVRVYVRVQEWTNERANRPCSFGLPCDRTGSREQRRGLWRALPRGIRWRVRPTTRLPPSGRQSPASCPSQACRKQQHP
jgi:hypothetical protein